MKFDFSGLVRVGEGRGLVVQGRSDRFIVTAAHCLPWFPPCASFSDTSERTYQDLVGPLSGELSIWSECRFADPISDIAILGNVDNQALYEQAADFDQFAQNTTPLAVCEIGEGKHEAFLLTLDCEWFSCTVERISTALWIWKADRSIMGGMSGSPIMNKGGEAVGVVVTGLNTEGGPNPLLSAALPGWFLAEVDLL